MTENAYTKISEGLIARAQILEGSDGAEVADNWLLNELGKEASRQAAPLGGTMMALGEKAATTQGISDAFVNVGERVLRRLEREAYKLICGDTQQDIDDREALGLTGDVLIGVLTTALTAGLSVGPQVAAVVAAIIVRRLAHPTMNELCQVWSERLNA